MTISEHPPILGTEGRRVVVPLSEALVLAGERERKEAANNTIEGRRKYTQGLSPEEKRVRKNEGQREYYARNKWRWQGYYKERKQREAAL